MDIVFSVKYEYPICFYDNLGMVFVLLAITTLKFNVHQAGFAKSSFYPQCPCSNQHSGTTQICNWLTTTNMYALFSWYSKTGLITYITEISMSKLSSLIAKH